MIVRLSLALNRIVEGIVALLAAFFTGLLVVSVFSRYVFDISIVEGVELTRITFLWAVFLAASSVAARREHIRITFAVSWLSPSLQLLVLRFTELCILAFGTAMIWFGGILTLRMAPTFLPTLQISQAWLYAVLPIAGFLIVIHAIGHLTQRPDPANILRERRA